MCGRWQTAFAFLQFLHPDIQDSRQGWSDLVVTRNSIDLITKEGPCVHECAEHAWLRCRAIWSLLRTQLVYLTLLPLSLRHRCLVPTEGTMGYEEGMRRDRARHRQRQTDNRDAQ